MTHLRLAINGFGRIGRMLVRAFLLQPAISEHICLVAINDIADANTLLHLLRFDSTHGRLSSIDTQAHITTDNHQTYLVLSQHQKTLAKILLLQQKNPNHLPWADLKIDVVLECTGHFRSYEQANRHRQAGAKQVIIGAAPFDRVDASIVVGVNEHLLSRQLHIISGVSCTTQALVPLLHLLDNALGLQSVMMTEIHAVTADQTVLDHAHRDLRRARASGHNIIPTTSSSINATERVLPQLQGKLSGHSVRVPTINVACIDVTVVFNQDTTLEFIKQLLKNASQGTLRGIMDYSDEPLVSSDFVGDSHSLIIDGQQMMQANRQFKIFAWYDNEVGYAHRLLQMCHILARLD